MTWVKHVDDYFENLLYWIDLLKNLKIIEEKKRFILKISFLFNIGIQLEKSTKFVYESMKIDIFYHVGKEFN